MTLPNQQSIIYRVQQDGVLSFNEPNGTVASGTFQSPVVVPANTLNFAINLATLFPALTSAVALSVQENAPALAGIGFNIAASSTDPGFSVRPNSIFSYGINGTLPTIYVDNANLTTALELIITVTGS